MAQTFGKGQGTRHVQDTSQPPPRRMSGRWRIEAGPTGHYCKFYLDDKEMTGLYKASVVMEATKLTRLELEFVPQRIELVGDPEIIEIVVGERRFRVTEIPF